MEASALAGKVQTVLGSIAPEDLGVTLTHEHLLIDLSCIFVEPEEAAEKYNAYQPLTLQNVGWLRMNNERNLDNLQLPDEETAIAETLLFKHHGGQTIVEVTPKVVGHDPSALARIARATELNIVMGTAYYISETHPTEMDGWTVDSIADTFIKEIRIGAGNTTVHAGIIGEIGCSSPMTNNEKKVLRAAIIAQQETGAPLMIHPGYDESSALEIIQILRDAGADLGHTIISHMSRTVYDSAVRFKLMQEGCYLEWDLFGRESYPFPPFQTHSLSKILPCDPEQVDQICELIAQGYEKQILVSHDVCFKMSLTCYGGHGYAYILRYVVPLMRYKGLSEEQISIILRDNPRDVLAFR
jgi:phosphotriesterase-related protein